MTSGTCLDDLATAAQSLRRRAEWVSRRLLVVTVADIVVLLAATSWGIGTPKVVLLPTAIVAGTIAYLVGEPFFCRRAVLRELSRFTPSEQAELLRALQRELSDDAADIVSPLMGRLRATELLPSHSREGRGDETSPSGS